MNVNDAIIFTHVARSKSVTHAAQQMGLAKSKVSRRLQALENELGVRLMERTTRSISLTEAGNLLYEKCLRIHQSVKEAEAVIETFSDQIQGRLKVSVSTSMGQAVIAPVIAEFMRRYPLIELELLVTNRRVDLIAEGVDVAIRIGRMEDSSYVCKKMGELEAGIYASPDYLKAAPELLSPEDLVAHRVLSMLLADRAGRWHLDNGQQLKTIDINPVFGVNDFGVLSRVCEDGAGIACIPAYKVTSSIDDGRLVRVLPQWRLPSIEFYALFPSREGISNKTRLWLDFLQDTIFEENKDHL